MSNLQTYYHFKLDFQKVDQHTVGKWLIHDTKRRKDNQLQSLELQDIGTRFVRCPFLFILVILTVAITIFD